VSFAVRHEAGRLSTEVVHGEENRKEEGEEEEGQEGQGQDRHLLTGRWDGRATCPPVA
jgi:hypothetical protein